MNQSACDILDEENKKKCITAIEYVKLHKKELISKFADPSIYLPEPNPISVFMAGSPGAGKTEFSKGLISELVKGGIIKTNPVRIDSDDVREMLPEYTGNNSYIFQAASSIMFDKLYDHVLKNKQSAIIDGTFSNDKSIENIQRSIDRGRHVEIFYIYQEPVLAWTFTKKREVEEGRNIPKESFIQAFLASKANVNKVKDKFGEKVTLNLVKKNYENGLDELKINIDNVDNFLDIRYNREDLEKLII